MFLAKIRQEGARRGPSGDLHSSGGDGVLHKPCLEGVGRWRAGGRDQDGPVGPARSRARSSGWWYVDECVDRKYG